MLTARLTQEIGIILHTPERLGLPSLERFISFYFSGWQFNQVDQFSILQLYCLSLSRSSWASLPFSSCMAVVEGSKVNLVNQP